MMKHIFGQAFYQLSVMMVLLFAGEYFIPEENIVKNGIPLSFNGKIRPGRAMTYSGDADKDWLYAPSVHDVLGPSRHFTIIFCAFIFMQLFNEYNSMSINDELVFWRSLKENLTASIILFIEVIICVVIVQFGSVVFDLYPGGLTWYQWLICLAFAFGTILTRIVLVHIPNKPFIKVFLYNVGY